ncbi:hypothetical protein ONS95_012681 [Cadophora gregata]|uniref:uncharacterized protein n=1 Tax=Cadophora gregata TaxID=51156 RepID=UPI0026DA7D54|nr:uncharacterized protein ONS95_012681 [Cadophora gregata]KAK0118392.1 hypothetical protein ONS95_012681 [Cadophora gregata]
MELWLHYIKYTSEATSVVCGGKPELGLSCDYLLHGMLATAASHLAYLKPDHRAKYNLLSRQHQDLALGPFQQAMESITEENASFVFSYGILLVVGSLSSSEIIPTQRGNEPSSRIADWVICIRGCRSVCLVAKSDIGGFPINELQKLRETFAFTVQGFNATLTVAMKIPSPNSVPQRMSNRLLLTLWPLTVTDAFVRLLSEMRPPALIIMAHYCLILRRGKDCWYMAESGLKIFQAIQHYLGEEWSAYVEYPRRVFGL